MCLSRIPAVSILCVFILAAIFYMSGSDALVDEVCYEANFPRECSQHVLQCPEGHLAIEDGFRGFKDPLTCFSQSRRTNCTGAELCSRHSPRDCLVTFSSQTLATLMDLCQNQTNCTFVPSFRERKRECNDSFETISSYSRILYHCTQADDDPSASFTTSSTDLPSSGTEAGVIGGAVGAAVLIVLAVVGICCFRRRQSAEHQANKHGGSPGAGLANPAHLPAASSQTSLYEDASGARTLAFPGATGSSDYDLLGHKRPDPSPRDVTYGHLNLSGDVTEGDYDHVKRDGKAEVSREVVDNVYSRAGPPGAAFDDSVHYDVSGAVTKQRCDVIDSPYDVTCNEGPK